MATLGVTAPASISVSPITWLQMHLFSAIDYSRPKKHEKFRAIVVILYCSHVVSKALKEYNKKK